MRTLYVYLILILFSAACRKEDKFFPVINVTDSAIHYLALGDSYTIGQSVAVSDRFPVQTTLMLRNNNVIIAEPEIIAQTGWTTANLIAALNDRNPGNNYDIVSLLIGVNNQYQGRSLEEYKNEFSILVNRSIQLAGNRPSRVFVLSIPDYSVTPFAQGSDTAAIAIKINEFNAANKEISLLKGVNYIDITSISREGRNDNSLQASDGLHPSGKQYKRWSELLVPVILQKVL